jgi:two-component system, NtrC family, response regulator HydG
VFRDDLYYRLNVVTMTLPPLRERGHDILLLIRYFTAKFAKELGKPTPVFSDETLHVMKKGYHWPGNVRELENAVHSLLVMGEGQRIEVADLPATMRFSLSRQPDLTRTLAEVEAEYIRNVLDSVGRNRTKTATILGIDRKTLREKLKVDSSRSA